MKKILVLFMLLFVPSLVYAHVYVIEVSPEQDSEVSEAPRKVTMVLGGSIEPLFSKIVVYGPKRKKVSKKTYFLEDDTVMEVELKEDLAPGVYKVKWKCVSLDGHKQKGKFRFTIL